MHIFIHTKAAARALLATFMMLWTLHATAQTAAELGTGDSLPSDIVLLLDNSGSMKANDPKFLTSKAVTEFINQLDFTTRLAIVIFDQKVKLAFPLTDINDQSRQKMLNSLNQINYRGLHTNSPDGLERAIYELKLHAREDTERFIIFLTDGIVDTGNKQKDATGVDWMRKELAADASKNNIRIFGIAFTDGADFKLIQSLAQQTDADYYRAFTANDIAPVFGKINEAIAKARIKAAEPVVTALPAPVAPVPAPAPAPIIVKVPEQPEDPLNQYILYGIVGLLVVIIMIVLLRRGGGGKSQSAASIPAVKLIDVYNVTGQNEYNLTEELTQIGRVKGKESPGVSHIIINRGSVSRHHAVIEYRNHAFWLMDQGSGNGTTLNGVAVTEERRLKHGDAICFDEFEFTFTEPELEQSDVTMMQASSLQAPAGDSFDEDETAFLPSAKQAPPPPPPPMPPTEAIVEAPPPPPPPPPPVPPTPESSAADTDDMMDDIANWDFETDDDPAEPVEKEKEDKTIPPNLAAQDADKTADNPDLVEEEDPFQPSMTMTPDQFERMFEEIDKGKDKK